MKGTAASLLPLLHNRHKVVFVTQLVQNYKHWLFEVLTLVPFTLTSLPTLQLASASCKTQGFGSSSTSHGIFYQAMTSSL